MISRQDAITAVQTALDDTKIRLLHSPMYGVYIHADEQLKIMIDMLILDPLPPESERAFVNIGIMTAKELEAEEPKYADVLMLASYSFKNAEVST
jgi:Tsi6